MSGLPASAPPSPLWLGQAGTGDGMRKQARIEVGRVDAGPVGAGAGPRAGGRAAASARLHRASGDQRAGVEPAVLRAARVAVAGGSVAGRRARAHRERRVPRPCRRRCRSFRQSLAAGASGGAPPVPVVPPVPLDGVELLHPNPMNPRVDRHFPIPAAAANVGRVISNLLLSSQADASATYIRGELPQRCIPEGVFGSLNAFLGRAAPAWRAASG